MEKPLTLEEIGKLAGVSRSTVSRVINDQPDVRQDVRHRVLKVIQATGYQPNQAARSLASHRSGILGLVIPRSVATVFADPYFPRLTQGIAQACNAQGFTLSLFLFHTEEDEQKMMPRIAQRGFLDGVIVQATTDIDPTIPLLQKSSIPFLVVGRLSKMSDDLNYIDVDNESAAHNAVIHLIRLGYQRIAHITGPLDNRPAIDRKKGYEAAFMDRGLPLRRELIFESDFTENGGYFATQRLLKHKPDAIFVASDSMALGAIRAIQNAGLSIPEDIAIVGFDDLPPAQYANPKLTTVRQPILRFGINAVETLIDIVNNGSEPPRRVLYGTELIVRESCGAKR